MRKILVSNQEIKSVIPSFVKYYSNLAEFWTYIQPKFSTYQLRREHIIEEFKPLILSIENPNESSIHSSTKVKLNKLNSASVHQLWQKAIDRLDGDSDGAITVASTLLEDTIKNILNDLSVEYSERDKLPKLYGLLATKLNLSPSQHTEEIFKQILGGCHSIVQGLGSLRKDR